MVKGLEELFVGRSSEMMNEQVVICFRAGSDPEVYSRLVRPSRDRSSLVYKGSRSFEKSGGRA